ncbi:unnamed protein product [Sphagnum balticum]
MDSKYETLAELPPSEMIKELEQRRIQLEDNIDLVDLPDEDLQLLKEEDEEEEETLEWSKQQIVEHDALHTGDVKRLLEDLYLRRRHYFEDAELVIKIEPPEGVAEELLRWGVLNDEPMGIYLAEKLCMITSQVIDHKTAMRVSDYMSHTRPIPSERIDRAKDALRVVGKINREVIYDFSKEYQHISVRKSFSKYLLERQRELKGTSLDYFVLFDPLKESDE